MISRPAPRWRGPHGVLALAAVLLWVAGCGIGFGNGSVSSKRPAAPADVSGIATIGRPADDGARIIGVDPSGGRIRDLTIDSPAVGTQRVRLLVPAKFEAQPATQWPALFLLRGAYGSYVDWTQSTDVEELTASADIVVVMPDAGHAGWYSDWWNGGAGGPPRWETFYLTELPQLLERNWRISRRRVVAGLSMGGYGAMALAARRPGTFLAAASYSGAVDPLSVASDPRSGDLFDPAMWGDPDRQAEIWRAHDPVNLAAELEGTPLYVSYGDGPPGPFDNGVASPSDIEGWVAEQNRTFVDRLDQLGIPVTVDAYGPGSHSWPYWERALHRSFPMLLAALAP